MNNDDLLPEAYKYFWAPEITTPTLDEYLSKFKPSMVQNDGTKPWIWVQGKADSETTRDVDKTEAVKEATKLLKEVTEKVESIKNDDSIPVRSNKKTGAKSKKEVREQVQAEATEKLKELSLKYGYVSGKWLVFAPPDKVDYIWSGIASSLVSGPLRNTSADVAKVSTSSPNENSNAQHIICIYFPNVYEKEKVTEIMKILLRNHGVNLSGVKSNLYTSIGIDSKHPSGIPSTVWKNTSILSDKEIKELKDSYFAELSSTKPGATSDGGGVGEASASITDSKADTAPAKTATKSKPKKKVEDPFASDEEGTKTEKKISNSAETSQALKGKIKPKLKKKGAADPFVSDSDDHGAETSRQKKPVKSTATGSKKRQQSDLASASDEEPAVQKKRK